MKNNQRTKKILFIVPYFVPAWSYGGTVKASYDFAKELVRKGHSVTVATTDVLDDKTRISELNQIMDGINIIRFKNVSNILAKKYNLYLPHGFKKWIRKNIKSYDIVHIHELFTYQSIFTSSICHKAHIPYIVQPHGSLSEIARNSRMSKIKTLLLNKFPALASLSNAIIALNEEEKKVITNIFPGHKNIIIVNNGLDFKEFKNIRKINLHNRFHIPKSNKVIVFIGRLKFIKGLDISLQALSLLKNKINFTFLIIGPDEGEKNALEKLSERLGLDRQVIFTDLLAGNNKLEALKNSDLSLLNSRSEGLPTTLLESAALGLPIVCSKESNFPEVKKYKAGYIVGNANETAKKIEKVLKDDKLQKGLSENALKLAKSFDISACTKTLIKVYETFL